MYRGFGKVTYTERFGLGGAFITKATAQLMRDFGAIQSPQNAFYLNLGLESLHVRMKRHAENGLAVARYLRDHEKIAWVKYCGLEEDEDYQLAQKYLPDGSCGVVSFGVKGGRKAAPRPAGSRFCCTVLMPGQGGAVVGPGAAVEPLFTSALCLCLAVLRRRRPQAERHGPAAL